MPRPIPPDRFTSLIAAGREVLLREGLANMQMEHVADAMGVAKGTVYRYVESKEALFAAVALDVVTAGESPQEPPEFPLRTPPREETLRAVSAAMKGKARYPRLEAALAGPVPPPDEIGAEVTEIVTELHDLLAMHGDEIRLVERCAEDLPDLAELWFREGRIALVGKLANYLVRRGEAGLLPVPEDPPVQARLLLETLTMWAVHRADDPAPQTVDEPRARRVLIRFVTGGILRGEDA